MKKIYIRILLTILMIIIIVMQIACNEAVRKNKTTVIEKSNEFNKGDKLVQEQTIKMNKQTQHFMFYCIDNDKQYLDKLSSFIEGNYDRITTDLEYKPQNKVSVYFWPSYEKLHEALGVLGASNLLRGGFRGGVIHTVSPNLMWGIKMENVLLEEFTHVLIDSISIAVPKWLHEGISGYEAGTRDENDVDITVKSRVLSDTIPLFEELDTWEFDKFEGNNGYQFSDTISQFLIKKHGFKKINKFIRSPYDYEGVFGVSKGELEKQWINYLKEKYNSQATD